MSEEKIWQTLSESTGGRLTKQSKLSELKDLTDTRKDIMQEWENRCMKAIDKVYALESYMDYLKLEVESWSGDPLDIYSDCKAQAYLNVKQGTEYELQDFFESFMGMTEIDYYHIEESAKGVDYAFAEKQLKEDNVEDITRGVDYAFAEQQLKEEKRKKNDLVSFDYKYKSEKPENITDFYNALKKNGYIHEGTKLPAFRKVFTNKPITKKIIWIGGPTALTYIIRQLHKSKLHDKRKKLWSTVCYCFTTENGVFNPKQLNNEKKPTDTSKLDKIIELL